MSKAPSTPKQYVQSHQRRYPNAPRTPSRMTILPGMTKKKKEKMSRENYITWIDECEFILKEERAEMRTKQAGQRQINDIFMSGGRSASNAGGSGSQDSPKKGHSKRKKFIASPTPATATLE